MFLQRLHKPLMTKVNYNSNFNNFKLPSKMIEDWAGVNFITVDSDSVTSHTCFYFSHLMSWIEISESIQDS